MYRFKRYTRPSIVSGHLNLGGKDPVGGEISLNSAYFTRNGKPWIPIMGEFHFSRCNRSDWKLELAKMKAGGITVVPTYIFWIYHEEIEGKYDFSGDNDVRGFIEECRDTGLDVEIRIGPWCHGECRNGGFPDWMLKKDFALRDNNPGYLTEVCKWYRAIAEQVKGLYYKDGGPIVAVQIENEYCDNAEHLAELKRIAIECGMITPLYTVTGWNSSAGAKIPVNEVVPLFGGYCDAPWHNGLEELPPSPHYFFNQMRNDSAIGDDLIPQTTTDDDGWQLPYELYPFSTCELGGGLQNTYHRRYIIEGMDIYAISLIKLGCGNNLPGYYMYHGGTNKLGKLSTFQESKATGYPNDYAILSYDFQAPLSEYGEVREQYRLLNLLHLFLQDFQEWFAPMTAVDAETQVPRDDTSSLRYGMRTDGRSGMIFVNHYQRRSKLEDISQVEIDTGRGVIFPPMDLQGDISFFLPFKMDLVDIEMVYATAQPVCRHENTFFFVAIPGIPVQYRMVTGAVHKVEPGLESGFSTGKAKIITISWNDAKYLRRLGGEIFIGKNCDLYQLDGKIHAVDEGEFEYLHWTGDKFESLRGGKPFSLPTLKSEEIEAPPFNLDPMLAEELLFGGDSKQTWKKLTIDSAKGFIEIQDEYDVAQIYADEKLVADNFYYGKPWRVPASLLFGKECYLVYSEMHDNCYREF